MRDNLAFPTPTSLRGKSHNSRALMNPGDTHAVQQTGSFTGATRWGKLRLESPSVSMVTDNRGLGKSHRLSEQLLWVTRCKGFQGRLEAFRMQGLAWPPKNKCTLPDVPTSCNSPSRACSTASFLSHQWCPHLCFHSRFQHLYRTDPSFLPATNKTGLYWWHCPFPASM